MLAALGVVAATILSSQGVRSAAADAPTPSPSESVLYSFKGGADGAGPEAGLITDTSGNLYGTTRVGGTFSHMGTVFQLTPEGAESVLHSFGNVNVNDGAEPYGDLVMDIGNNLYGTTFGGGTHSEGAVFQVSPPFTSGGTSAETVIYNFNDQDGDDGEGPEAGLIIDEKGNLYGTTFRGGRSQ